MKTKPELPELKPLVFNANGYAYCEQSEVLYQVFEKKYGKNMVIYNRVGSTRTNFVDTMDAALALCEKHRINVCKNRTKTITGFKKLAE